MRTWLTWEEETRARIERAKAEQGKAALQMLALETRSQYLGKLVATLEALHYTEADKEAMYEWSAGGVHSEPWR